MPMFAHDSYQAAAVKEGFYLGCYYLQESFKKKLGE